MHAPAKVCRYYCPTHKLLTAVKACGVRVAGRVSVKKNSRVQSIGAF